MKKTECNDCDREWDYEPGGSLECLCGGTLIVVERSVTTPVDTAAHTMNTNEEQLLELIQEYGSQKEMYGGSWSGGETYRKQAKEILAEIEKQIEASHSHLIEELEKIAIDNKYSAGQRNVGDKYTSGIETLQAFNDGVEIMKQAVLKLLQARKD